MVSTVLCSEISNRCQSLIYGETITFIYHIITIIITTVFTLLMSYLLFKLVDLIIPLRVREDQEERGLDASQHGELYN